MPGFFEAWANRKPPKAKKFFITVEGVEHEVPLEKKLWAMKVGESNLRIENGNIVLVKIDKARAKYRTLQKADNGYFFESDDIRWPNSVGAGGVTWQIESE
jgi:SOS-response transcriptional repressor LexA